MTLPGLTDTYLDGRGALKRCSFHEYRPTDRKFHPSSRRRTWRMVEASWWQIAQCLPELKLQRFGRSELGSGSLASMPPRLLPAERRYPELRRPSLSGPPLARHLGKISLLLLLASHPIACDHRVQRSSSRRRRTRLAMVRHRECPVLEVSSRSGVLRLGISATGGPVSSRPAC